MLPPKPGLFYGREYDAEDILSWIIISHSALEYGIVHSGGIDKKSVALAVMQHPNIVAQFQSHCVWARCEPASSVELPHGILASAFQIQDGLGTEQRGITYCRQQLA
ncbi:hypothetical protein FRB96_006361 [Tulasnella sp. 330]|nr:hypothetical protein FRB96_006361 [Tulasnella sp. 330]KAG8872317.1 hypothetical protein FRB98_009682 [Tulasnella sp. 332]